MTERFYRVDDIPDYPILFIRDGGFVFETDKYTGEIQNKLCIEGYVKVWCSEWVSNPIFKSYYHKGYSIPKQNPDTAKSLKELKKLCSDNTRHRKGDTGYLLDFLMEGDCNKTESKIFLHLSKNVIVWNYCITSLEEIKSISELKSDKQLKAVWKSIQEKGLVTEVRGDIETSDGVYKMLVKLHPKLYWEGRYSAWLVKCKADYEYEDPITIC